MNTFETVLFEKKDHIATITLNRPKMMNTFNIQMRDDLHQVLSAIRDDDETYVVLLKGAGDKAFCAGADLSEFLTAPPPVIARRIRAERDIWLLFVAIEKPMIAAVHGYVLGSGLEIASYCDIRISAEGARFGLPEVGLGIIPGAGGTQTIPRIIGPSRAIEMLLTNRWIGSAEAAKLNLVNRVVAQADLYSTALEIAYQIASFDQDAVRNAKIAVKNGMDLTIAEGLKLEERLLKQLTIRKLYNTK